ncbi:MAG: hypothetical protein QM660_11025 [Dysgonomonas sp.]
MRLNKGEIYNIKYIKREPARYSRTTGIIASYFEREMIGDYEFIGKRNGKLYFYGIWNGDDAFLDIGQFELIKSK